MTARIRLALVFLIALPAIALAQRGGRGGGGGGGRGGSDTESQPPLPQQLIVNGVNLIIGHRQELALTDSQVVQIVRIKRTLDSANVPLMRRLDSLQQVIQPSRRFPAPPPSDDKDQPHSPAQAQIDDALLQVRGNIQPARDSAFALLSPTQRDRASAIEREAQGRVDALLHPH